MSIWHYLENLVSSLVWHNSLSNECGGVLVLDYKIHCILPWHSKTVITIWGAYWLYTPSLILTTMSDLLSIWENSMYYNIYAHNTFHMIIKCYSHKLTLYWLSTSANFCRTFSLSDALLSSDKKAALTPFRTFKTSTQH